MAIHQSSQTLSWCNASALLDIVNVQCQLHPGMLTFAASCTNTISNLLLSWSDTHHTLLSANGRTGLGSLIVSTVAIMYGTDPILLLNYAPALGSLTVFHNMFFTFLWV